MDKERSSIRIGDIIYSVFDGKWIVIVLMIAGLLAGILVSVLGYVRGEMSKQYKIEASVVVSSQIGNGTFASTKENPTKDDITLAKEMTEQAIYIIKSDKTVSMSIEKLGMVGVSVKSLKNNLSLKQYNASQIIEISFLWRSKDEGIKFLKTLEETANDIMLSTLKIGRLVSVNEPTAAYMFGGEFDITTWLYFALAGLVVGVGICFLRRFLRPTLIRAEDLDDFYDLEVLENFRLDSRFAMSDPFMIAPEDMDTSVASTAYILMNRMERSGVKSFYVTSAGRQEGKTTLLADFAVKISETGKKVLLVDCDFDNPSLAPLFHVNLKYENSLNALYNGDSDSSDAITRLSGNLHLLAYLLEDNPDPLSLPLLRLIQSVEENYDFVLIDAAPIGENAEVLRLNTIADAVLFVVKFDGPKMSEIDTSLTRLRKAGIPLLGAVVNESKTLLNVLFELKKRTKRKTRKFDFGTKNNKKSQKNQKDKTEILQ